MKIYISVVSLLTVWDALCFLFTRRWPSFDTLVKRADALGADGVQLLILRGWDPEEFFSSDKICSIEPAWEGFLGRILFHDDSQTAIEMFQELRRHGNFPTIPTVDIKPPTGIFGPKDFVEISGKKIQIVADVVEALRARRHSTTRLVLDTHHVREILPNSSSEEWMPPLWKTFLGHEPKKIKRYNNDEKFRIYYNSLLREVFSVILPRTELVQVQTRSVREAMSCIRGTRSILTYELQILSEFYTDNIWKRVSVPVVIEIPPWWGWFSSSFKRHFVSGVCRSLN